MHDKFSNRLEAGRQLAEKLARYTDRTDCVVLALPRGGVPVGYAVAVAISAPLDVLVVRKLGVPGDEELAMGAMASGGIRVLNAGIVAAAQVPDRAIAAVLAREQQELVRRERIYRMGHHAQALRDRTVILVDDGIATGATMRVAISAARSQHASRIIVATPVAARSSYLELREVTDEMVALFMPKDFASVGQFYEDFHPTGDREVITLLTRARQNLWRHEAIMTPADALLV